MKMKDLKIKKKSNTTNLLNNFSLFSRRFSRLFSSPSLKLNFQNKMPATKLVANKMPASIMAVSKMPAPKLAISLALLLLLAACGGATGDTGGTGGSPDDKKPPKGEIPKVDPPKADPPKVDPPKVDPPKVDCSIVPIPLGCPGYIVPDNPYLKAAIASTERDSVILESSTHYKYIVTEKKYGTIAILKNKTSFTTAIKNDFTEANDDEIDKTKNNIIKITGRSEHTSGALYDPEPNYYYSHIEGKQFTRFLPAINQLAILGLGAKLVEAANIPTSGGLIFNGDNWREASGDAIYQRLKGLVKKAKDLTFKGFALVAFINYIANSKSNYYEKDFYPGKFILTFNSTGFGKTYDTVSEPASEYDFFSMKITLDQTVAATEFSLNVDSTVKSVAKPKIETIEIKNFSKLPIEPPKNKTYPTKDSKSPEWNHVKWQGDFAFNQTGSGDIDQIAGKILISRTVGFDVQYLVTTFASNEFCDSNKPDCERVTLTE